MKILSFSQFQRLLTLIGVLIHMMITVGDGINGMLWHLELTKVNVIHLRMSDGRESISVE